MSCNNDTPSPTILDIQYFTSETCFDCTNACGGQIYNSKCIIYTGPNLGCSGINSNDSLETALQKIDEQICTVTGDYSIYNLHCLSDYWGEPITIQAEFVSAITYLTCTLKTDITTFIDIIFPNYQTTVNTRFIALEVPGITCAAASVVNTDTLQQVLTKYCTLFTTINTKFDLSSVVWDNCYTVVSDPTTLPTAFQLLADQICDTKALITNYGLPLFNNLGSCIGGSSSDTLVTTIGLLKTAVCARPTFDINTLTWGCLTKPSSTATDLQSAFQTLLTSADDFVQNKLTFSEDFIVTQTDEEDVCSGKTVTLATPLNIDRFVAATATDTSPGTLQSKLVAGTNLTLDFTTPTQVTINATSNDTYKVKANTAESTGDAGFLDQKIAGITNDGIALTTSYNVSTKKVDVTPSVDNETFWDNLYNYIKTNVTAQSLFCDLASVCSSSGAASFTWTFENTVGAVSGSNTLTVTDKTIPGSPAVILSTSLSSPSGTPLPANGPISLIAGHLYEVRLEWVANNTVGDLTIIDTTIGYTLIATDEYDATNPNVFPFTASAGHQYTIAAHTWNNT